MSNVLSFRASDQQIERLDALCAATDRVRVWHLQKALERYLEEQSWHVESIIEGIQDADNGNLIDLDDIKSKKL